MLCLKVKILTALHPPFLQLSPSAISPALEDPFEDEDAEGDLRLEAFVATNLVRGVLSKLGRFNLGAIGVEM